MPSFAIGPPGPTELLLLLCPCVGLAALGIVVFFIVQHRRDKK